MGITKRRDLDKSTTVYIEIEDMIKAKQDQSPEMSTGCDAIASIDKLLALGCKVVIASRNEILQTLNLAHPMFDTKKSDIPSQQEPGEDKLPEGKPILIGRNTPHNNKWRVERTQKS